MVRAAFPRRLRVGLSRHRLIEPPQVAPRVLYSGKRQRAVERRRRRHNASPPLDGTGEYRSNVRHPDLEHARMSAPPLLRVGQKQQGVTHVQLSMNESARRCGCPGVSLLNGAEDVFCERDESCRVFQCDERIQRATTASDRSTLKNGGGLFHASTCTRSHRHSGAPADRSAPVTGVQAGLVGAGLACASSSGRRAAVSRSAAMKVSRCWSGSSSAASLT